MATDSLCNININYIMHCSFAGFLLWWQMQLRPEWYTYLWTVFIKWHFWICTFQLVNFCMCLSKLNYCDSMHVGYCVTVSLSFCSLLLHLAIFLIAWMLSVEWWMARIHFLMIFLIFHFTDYYVWGVLCVLTSWPWMDLGGIYLSRNIKWNF
jgi:hypothetical protein